MGCFVLPPPSPRAAPPIQRDGGQGQGVSAVTAQPVAQEKAAAASAPFCFVPRSCALLLLADGCTLQDPCLAGSRAEFCLSKLSLDSPKTNLSCSFLTQGLCKEKKPCMPAASNSIESAVQRKGTFLTPNSHQAGKESGNNKWGMEKRKGNSACFSKQKSHVA